MTNNASVGTKKSKFIASTVVNPGSYFDFVINGQNVRILDTDFYAALGVSGTIIQGGNPLGSPVLDKQGNVNVIRNILGGFGINVDVDAQNSITIGTGFSFNNAAIPIVDDVSSESPSFRSFAAGSNISLEALNGVITIASLSRSADNRVYINSASDFPDAISGVIFCAANTEYYIGSSVTVASRFDLSAGNVVFSGPGTISSLIYTGEGDMFSGVDVGSAVFKGLNLSQPNALAGDALWSFSDTSSPLSIVNISSIRVDACDTIAIFQNIIGVTVDIVAVFNANNGILIDGSGFGTLSLAKILVISSSASFVGIDLGINVFNAFEASNVQFIAPIGSIGISGLDDSGNIPPNQIASITSCEFIGGITALDGLNDNDVRYLFFGNSGIQDTRASALSYLTANATPTVISAAGTPTLILGDWINERSSHFEVDSTGRITYIGEKSIVLPITLAADLQPVSGTNKDLTLCIALNGTQINGTGREARIDSGNPQSLTSIWQHEFVNGDYIEAFVQNDSDATNILVSGGVLRLR